MQPEPRKMLANYLAGHVARHRGGVIPDGEQGAQLAHLVRGGCILAPDAYLFTVIDRTIPAGDILFFGQTDSGQLVSGKSNTMNTNRIEDALVSFLTSWKGPDYRCFRGGRFLKNAIRRNSGELDVK